MLFYNSFSSYYKNKYEFNIKIVFLIFSFYVFLKIRSENIIIFYRNFKYIMVDIVILLLQIINFLPEIIIIINFTNIIHQMYPSLN